MPVPLASQHGSFYREYPSFYQLNILFADIPCVLENGVVEGARPTQPVTLHITVKITPPNLHNGSPSIPTDATIPGPIQFPVPKPFSPLSHDRPVETGPTSTMPGPIQFPVPEPFLPPSHHQPTETGPTIPQGPEAIIYRSYMWEGAIERIKWVIDALGSIPEVRVMPF